MLDNEFVLFISETILYTYNKEVGGVSKGGKWECCVRIPLCGTKFTKQRILIPGTF